MARLTLVGLACAGALALSGCPAPAAPAPAPTGAVPATSRPASQPEQATPLASPSRETQPREPASPEPGSSEPIAGWASQSAAGSAKPVDCAGCRAAAKGSPRPCPEHFKGCVTCWESAHGADMVCDTHVFNLNNHSSSALPADEPPQGR